MKIDRDLVRSVARLAALDLAESEVALLAEELTRIVEHFEELRRLPDELLPPLPEPTAAPLRDDVPSGGPGERSYVSQNAPDLAHSHFVVPRVVSRSS